MEIDLASIVGTGGPIGVIAFLAGLLVKAYFEAKKDKREQQTADVQEETGIIANTKSTLDLVRIETERMHAKNIALDAEVTRLTVLNRSLEGRALDAERRAKYLQEDLDRMRSDGIGAT